MSERSPLSQRAPGKAGIYRQLGEIPALSIVVSRVVGSQGGCQEPKLGPACEQDLQGHRHGILLPNHQTDRKVGLGSFPRSAGICLPDRSGSEPAEETARPHPPPVPFRRVPPSSPSRDSGGPSLVGLAGESEQMVPIWTVGAFLSSLDRCVRDWLGRRSRSEGCLGSGVMEPLREYSSHEPPQAEGDPSHPCQQHASSGEFHQSFFGQFHHCPSSAETGLLEDPIGDQGAARHPVSLQEEVAVHLSSQDPRQAQCACGCLVEGCSPPRGRGV